MKKLLQRVTLSLLLALGLTGGLSASAENLAPVVSLTAPTNGTVFAQGQIIEFSVDANDDGAVTNVDLYVDGLLIGNTTIAPYGMSWSGASLGCHSLTAVAQDDAGQATTSTAVTVSVKTLANLLGYVSGDFHQHTTYTDGYNPFATVMAKDNEFGLDWWANSEHGGKFNRNAAGPILTSGYDTGAYAQFLDTLGLTFLGDLGGVSGGHTNMWRWQTLRDFSFVDLLAARSLYPSKTIVQGVEWNVPGHEHCSVGIIADEFGPSATNANAVAQFEYLWDANDADLSLGAKNTTNTHAKAVQAVAWMQANYPTNSWMVPAHPERRGVQTYPSTYTGSGSQGYSAGAFRDLNNAGPSVCFGFESMPGHQKAIGRGGYTNSASGGGTYGGCGYYAAKVGGLWDAMLGEGRGFWLFASSDFHTTVEDFWPGEYQKTYTRQSGNDPQSIVDGLRSGDSFVVEGDLIDALDFTVNGAKMGSRLYATSTVVTVSVRVHDPEGANNCPTNLPVGINTPLLDHIDVIAGQFGGLIATNDPAYLSDSNVTTRVVGRFDAIGGATDSQGVTSTAWTDEGGGWKRMTLTYDTKGRKTYFRLRGSNLGLGVAGQTDAAGNPLLDPQSNDALKAWADLWFYSNPVFVQTPTVKVDANVYQSFNVGMTNGAWVYLEADPSNASPLRATQRSLGYREVDYKATMFSFLRFTQVAPSNTGAGVMYDYTAQKTKGTYTVGYWKDKDLPVMVGPDGNAYITDGHHTSAGYLSPVNTQIGDVVPGLHRVVLGHVVTNFYNAAVGPVAVTDTWWTNRMAENNAMLYGVDGNQLALSGDAGYAGLLPILPSTLAMPVTPSTLGAQAMTHDHYRGLAWGLADGILKTATNGATKIKGYSKTNPETGLDINFVEFFWSDYLRNRIVWDDTKSGHALGSGFGDANAISAPVSFFAAVANGIAMARSQDYRDQYGRGIVDYTNSALFSANTARWASKSIANGSYPAVAGDVYNLFLLDDSGIAGDIAPSPVAVNILHIDTSAGMVVSNRLVNIRNVAINAGGAITTVWKDAVVTNTTLTIPAGTSRVTLKGSNTVSGAVTLANGTLAVDGSLTAASLSVASGATLEYTPSSAPITVTGALTLNGTLNITGSGFGVGTYTLFNYGSLSGSGLVVGSVPDSSHRYSISTNAPGEVQLLVENTPPSVSLVAPTSGVTYLRGQTVSLAATAADDVSVAGVTFTVDGVLVGTDTVEPYTASWTATTVGSHELTAVAQDGAGLMSTSTVTVTVAQPSVTHVGATYSEGNANGHEYGVDAFTSIQGAIEAVQAGGTVWVTNGVYNTGSTNLNGVETRVALTKAVTVRSINGAAVTVIEGAADKSATNGPSAVRCAYVGGGASLVGFTLTNGHTRELPTGSYTPAWDLQVFGGGIFAEAGGLVSDCLIKGNTASLGGGGAAVESAATLRDCVVVGNSSPYGGGVAALTTAMVESCTLSDNSASTQAGGLYADHAVVRNTIIWSNTAPTSAEYFRSAGTFLRNCAKPLPVGTGNIAVAPQFIGQAWGNYALAGTSPCIDAGTNQSWMTGAKDVNGQTRLQDGNGDGKTIVDIGAYEFGAAPRLVITANGFNAPLTVAAGERVQVAITVNKGAGVPNKDWWLLQETPDANWQYYDTASGLWKTGIKVTYKGPFASMGVTPMLESTTLPVGTNLFYFGVDSRMDGILQPDKLIYDSVQVIVTP